jgi:hypothetical protein
MAFHTDDIIRVFVTNEKLELRIAIGAIILVQWHKKYLQPIYGKRVVSTDIVVSGFDRVKSAIKDEKSWP